MNTRTKSDETEGQIRARSGVRLRRAFAVGVLMGAIAWVSAPITVAEGVPEQIAALQQQVTTVQATVNSQAGQISALQATVSSGTSQISGLLEILSNETSQISALQTTVSSQTSQISGLQDIINGQAEQLSVLTNLLVHFSRVGNEVYITAANLHIVNGLNSTDTTNSLGNLIVGYNELRGTGDDRSGSHNVVAGSMNNFSSFGGLVVGLENTITGRFASVSGGNENGAYGDSSTVSGGFSNFAFSFSSAVSGGMNDNAGGDYSWSACGGSCTY